MASSNEIRAQHRAVVTEAKGITDAARAAHRGLTDGEKARLDDLLAQADGFKADIDRAVEDEARLKAVGELFGGSDNPITPGEGGSLGALNGRKGYLRANMKDAARTFVHQGQALGSKSLVVGGESLVEPVLVSDAPVHLGAPATGGLFDLVPTFVGTPSNFAYLRQTTREMNAAIVPDHEVKPTSRLGIESVTREMKVLAHVSEAIPERFLWDSETLADFIASEFAYGIVALSAAQVLYGDGTASNLHGIASESGVQHVASAGDALVTLRKAITAAETLGYTPSGIVMSPASWEAIELRTTTTGEYVMNPNGQAVPVDRSTRRVWGVPVAVDTAAQGSDAFLISQNAVALHLDGPLKAKWITPGDTALRNEVVLRSELRAEVSVVQPQGVVRVDLGSGAKLG